jgi:hypothetical protein
MYTNRPPRYSIVLKDFVSALYGPYNVSRLLEKKSLSTLAREYIYESIQHGAKLYRELEALEILSSTGSNNTQIYYAERTLIPWMQKVTKERVEA